MKFRALKERNTAEYCPSTKQKILGRDTTLAMKSIKDDPLYHILSCVRIQEMFRHCLTLNLYVIIEWV